MKDIEYEKDGVKKMAQERFKEDLIAAGWKVVEKPVPKPVKKRTSKKDDE